MALSTVRRAKAGDAEAQNTLGEMYESGSGVKQDDAAAVTWFLKAADQGHANAQCRLAVHCRTGQGVPRNAVAAVMWFRKAADQGDAFAQFSLGWMYRDGEGVAQDAVEAAAWFRKGAEQGDRGSQYKLAELYRNGEGVPQDDVLAEEWRYKAGARDRAAEQERREKSGEMTYVDECGQSLVRDPIVIRALKKEYPTDWARRVKRLRGGGTPTDDEIDMLGDLIHNEGRVYLTFHGKGADYDESDPSDVDLYPIDVRGLGGIYFVQGSEFGNSGFFHSLDQAESYVWDHWAGVDIFGPKTIRPPFGVKKNIKKRNAKKNVKKKNITKKNVKKSVARQIRSIVRS